MQFTTLQASNVWVRVHRDQVWMLLCCRWLALVATLLLGRCSMLQRMDVNAVQDLFSMRHQVAAWLVVLIAQLVMLVIQIPATRVSLQLYWRAALVAAPLGNTSAAVGANPVLPNALHALVQMVCAWLANSDKHAIALLAFTISISKIAVSVALIAPHVQLLTLAFLVFHLRTVRCQKALVFAKEVTTKARLDVLSVLLNASPAIRSLITALLAIPLLIGSSLEQTVPVLLATLPQDCSVLWLIA